MRCFTQKEFHISQHVELQEQCMGSCVANVLFTFEK